MKDKGDRVFSIIEMEEADKELYAKYKLSDEEIDHIEKVIKPMSDSSEDFIDEDI